MKFCGSKPCDHGTSESTWDQNIIAVAENDHLMVPTGWKTLSVFFLTKKRLFVALQLKCKIGEILDYVCRYLDLQQSKVFGLAVLVNGEYRFLDRNDRVSDKSCILRKSFSKSNGPTCDPKNLTSSVILHLRVHTYIDCIGYIKCHVSLHHYYLQLRENIKTQWNQSLIVEERCFEAAAYALQADFGDFHPDLPSYFNPLDYFPAWIVEKHGKDFLVRHMPVMHSDLKRLTKEDCMVKFCREVSRPPWPINLNLYTLRKHKNDKCDNALLGVTSKGLEFFEVRSNGQRCHIYTFVWSKIGKVAFDVRKFFVCGVDDKKLVFYTTSSEKSRYLLTLCRSIHQCLMNLHAELAEAKKAELKENHNFRESYIYSDIRDFDWIQNRCSDNNLEFQNCKNRALLTGQRVSLVSGASSNTTSGIVSDRQQNHDSENDNEDDMDLELTDAAGQCCSTAVENEHNSVTASIFDDGQPKVSKKRSSTMIRVDHADEADQPSTDSIVVRILAPMEDGMVFFDGASANNLVFLTNNSSMVNVGSIAASDRTLRTFSEDGHSVCTTCTTDKPDDYVDNELSSYDLNSRKVSTARSEPLKITSNENLYHSSITSNAKVSIDSLSSVVSASRSPYNVGNHIVPRSKFTVAELRQKTLDGFTGISPSLATASAAIGTRIVNGDPSIVVENSRLYQKSSSMKTLSTTIQTPASLSYLSFYKSACKVPNAMIDPGSNSFYDIIEHQSSCENSTTQASLEQRDCSQIDSAAYQIAENIPNVALMQKLISVNNAQIHDVDRSNYSKRWPTICGADQKYLSHQDMQFFEQSNAAMLQAKSEPRLTAWQLSVEDRECIRGRAGQSELHCGFPDHNCECLSNIEKQLADWSRHVPTNMDALKNCSTNYDCPSGSYIANALPSSSSNHKNLVGISRENSYITDDNHNYTRQNEHCYPNGLYLKQRPTSSSSTSIYSTNVPVRNKNVCNFADRSYGFRCSQAPVSRVQSMQIGRALNGSHLNSRLMAYRQKFLANNGFRHQRRTISSDAETAFIVNEQNCNNLQNAQNLCSSCRGEHHFSPDEIDLNELKSMISSRQDVDIPMIRALCDDTSLQDVRFRNGADKNNNCRVTEAVSRRPFYDGLLRPRSWHESAWLADNLVINNDFQPQNESSVNPIMTNSVETSSSAAVNPLQPSYETRFSSTPNLAASVSSSSRLNGVPDAAIFLPPPPPYSTSNTALDTDKQWRYNYNPPQRNCAYDIDVAKTGDDFYVRKDDLVYNGAANVASRGEYANFSNGVSGVYAVNCNILVSEQVIR